MIVGQALRLRKLHRSFGAELRNHAIEARQNADFAHDLEHVIETWSNTAAAHGHARRMDEVPCFASELLRERF
jgi:hypothetical protein